MSYKLINLPLSSTLFSGNKSSNVLFSLTWDTRAFFVRVNLSTRASLRSRMTLVATYSPASLSCTRAEGSGGWHIGGASPVRSDWRPEMRGGARAASPILK